MKALLVFLLCISPTIATLAQNQPSGPDATPQAVAKAIREGRLADAEKILQDAIRTAGQAESPQLSNYLRTLGVLYDGKGMPADALAVFGEIGDVGDYDVDAEKFGFGEHESGVDDDDVVAPAHRHAIHAEFAEAAKRNCSEGV